MSIEQALADNTAALKHLATVLASAGMLVAAPAVAAADAAAAKPAATKKADKAAAAPAALDFEKDVVVALKAIAGHTGEGRGRPGVVTLLTKYLPGDAKPQVPGLKPLVAQYEAIVADAKSLVDTGKLSGAAETPAGDDLGL